MKISKIHAREVLDSRGNPTVEAEVTLEDGSLGRAIVPSGASTGTHEALELRDKDSRYHGEGVQKAIKNVKEILSRELVGKTFDQGDLDRHMIQLDGTENKSSLGANAVLSVSLAFAWATANSEKRPLYAYIRDLYGNSEYKMPRPMFNIMNGGKHANWATDIQEYIVIPMKEMAWAEHMRIGSEIYNSLLKILKDKGLSINVGNEGGFAPSLESNQQALDFMVQAVEKAGYKLGEDIMFGFDAAASEFYSSSNKRYELKRDKTVFYSDEMVDWIVSLTEKYPIISFEDMLDEDDWSGWKNLTQKVGNKIQVVGDDLLVTNTKRIERAIKEKACNSLLVKVNQIGSLTEALEAMNMSEVAGWTNVVSHRSAETEDVTIAHIAVGTGCGQIKTGAPSRGERTAKYNELTRIAETLGL